MSLSILKTPKNHTWDSTQVSVAPWPWPLLVTVVCTLLGVELTDAAPTSGGTCQVSPAILTAWPGLLNLKRQTQPPH